MPHPDEATSVRKHPSADSDGVETLWPSHAPAPPPPQQPPVQPPVPPMNPMGYGFGPPPPPPMGQGYYGMDAYQYQQYYQHYYQQPPPPSKPGVIGTEEAKKRLQAYAAAKTGGADGAEGASP